MVDHSFLPQFGRLLIIFGAALIAVGALLMLGSRFSSFGLGHLPGDIVYKGRHGSFYFPIVSCIIVSVAITLVFWLVSFFTRH